VRVLGISSGTSFDGIDAIVVDLHLEGEVLVGEVLGRSATPYSTELRTMLAAMLPPREVTLREVAVVDALVGQEFAAAAHGLARAVGGVDAVGSHGQTLYHWVDEGTARGTLQLGQPAWIAERLEVPVVGDLRARDIAAGGQGAPLVVLLDELLLAGREGTQVALNIGGIANVTVVDPARPTIAYDIGPGNALIDAVVQELRLDPHGYDAGGVIAAQGALDVALLDALLADPYYRGVPPKSTGKEHFHLGHVRAATATVGRDTRAADLVRTLTELTALTVADAVASHGTQVLWASGGGVHNPVLMDRISALLPGVDMRPTRELGIAEDDKEALLFAVLGWYHLVGLPASVPSATGARGPRLLGSVTPGARPAVVELAPHAPRSLRLTPSGSPS